MFRRLLALATTCLALLAIASTALAGGWATSIVHTPDEFEAGVGYDVTYTVLQHGETPIDGETALLFSLDGAEPLRFVGTPTRTPGEYVATVELPSSGTWLIEVDQAAFGVVESDLIEVADSSVLAIPGGGLALGALVVLGGLLMLALARARRGSNPGSPVPSEM